MFTLPWIQSACNWFWRAQYMSHCIQEFVLLYFNNSPPTHSAPKQNRHWTFASIQHSTVNHHFLIIYIDVEKTGGTSTYALACEFNTYLGPTCLIHQTVKVVRNAVLICLSPWSMSLMRLFYPAHFRNRICYAKKNADLHQVWREGNSSNIGKDSCFIAPQSNNKWENKILWLWSEGL